MRGAIRVFFITRIFSHSFLYSSIFKTGMREATADLHLNRKTETWLKLLNSLPPPQNSWPLVFPVWILCRKKFLLSKLCWRFSKGDYYNYFYLLNYIISFIDNLPTTHWYSQRTTELQYFIFPQFIPNNCFGWRTQLVALPFQLFYPIILWPFS